MGINWAFLVIGGFFETGFAVRRARRGRPGAGAAFAACQPAVPGDGGEGAIPVHRPMFFLSTLVVSVVGLQVVSGES
ncbi:MAG: hypothetical protein IPH81_20345 [Candidatus Microthrix sp.]|nr:hypothetical protein [Candidatus Microthrix sp.]